LTVSAPQRVAQLRCPLPVACKTSFPSVSFLGEQGMTMRKLFWCSAAVAVAAAIGLYAAPACASRHPDSFLGPSLISAYRAGVASSPVYALGHAAFHAAGSSGERNCPCASVELRVESKILPAPDQPPGEVIDVSPYRLPGRITLQEDDGIRP